MSHDQALADALERHDTPASEDDQEHQEAEIIEGEQISADEDLLDDYPPETTEISCLHSRIRSIPSLNLSRFSRLESLCLRQNEITKIQDIPVTLKELDLYDNLIGHLDGLEECNALKVLDMSFNRIKHIKRINHLTNLKSLYFVQNKISKIENLEGLEKLEMLELGANRIREIENLGCLSALSELWLGKNKITRLAGLDTLTNLRILSIQSNRLTSITGLENLEKLEELYISHNGLTSLAGLASIKRLRVLDISNNKLTELTDIAHLTLLEELWASNNAISSFENIESQCRHLERLETVYFEGNPVQKDSGTSYITKLRLAVPPGIKQIDANMLK